ncbi:hypothetical protein [Magnetospira sp. QH-2]|uniref:hypothetical protein n=1 Tax=Magnetospira sp. (strain QH-2) TaxID=1288970 RepID=UPI0003E81C18|nr:hypothetical protein [Magnetospira sp. QH-2]CCQ73939.1 Conserved protein of unknown function [Magnetospira sp. QH-2]
MTKARARERAKAKAADKRKKLHAPAEPQGKPEHPGRFNPEASSIKGPGKTGSSKSFGPAKRGSARSG